MKKILIPFLFLFILIAPKYVLAGNSSVCVAPPAIGQCPSTIPDYYYNSTFKLKTCGVRYDCGTQNANCDTGGCFSAPLTYACPVGSADWAAPDVNLQTQNCCTDGQVPTWNDAGSKWECASKDEVWFQNSGTTNIYNKWGTKIIIGNTAVTPNAALTVSNSVAIGPGSTATTNSLGTGAYAIASGNTSFAAGWYPTASGSSSTAIGTNTTASGSNSRAIGYYSTASGDYSVAIGTRIKADGDYSVGIGLDNVDRTITQANSMTIMGGSVGIGTLTPYYKLDIVGGNYGIRVRPSDSVNYPRAQIAYSDPWFGTYGINASTWGIAGGIGVYGVGDYAIRGFATNNSGTGGWGGYFIGKGYFSDNVGIGTDADTGGYKLRVEGSTYTKGLYSLGEINSQSGLKVSGNTSYFFNDIGSNATPVPRIYVDQLYTNYDIWAPNNAASNCHWVGPFSEEGWNYRECPATEFMHGFKCEGGNCDNVTIQCCQT